MTELLAVPLHQPARSIAMRSERLTRLCALNAPNFLIEKEIQLCREAMARIELTFYELRRKEYGDAPEG